MLELACKDGRLCRDVRVQLGCLFRQGLDGSLRFLSFLGECRFTVKKNDMIHNSCNICFSAIN